MMELLGVGIGGFVGAVARYGVATWALRSVGAPFPLGTLLVNVAGCLLIGVLAGLVEGGAMIPPAWRSFVAVGLLGSFTTFSSLGLETVELLRAGALGAALGSLVANLLLGLGAVLAGRWITLL